LGAFFDKLRETKPPCQLWHTNIRLPEGVRFMVLRIRAFTLLLSMAVVAAGSLAAPATILAQEDAVAPGETSSIGGLEITVLEWIPDATGMVTEDMVPPGQLAEDEIHVIARLLIGNTGDNPDVAMGMGLPAFGVAGASRVGYLSDSCGSLYQSPLMITEIAAGNEGEIEICWRVPKADVDSLSMFVREYDPSQGGFMVEEDDEADDEPVGMTWFSLGNDPAPAYDGGQVLNGEIVDDGSLEDPIPVGSVGRIGSYEVAIASVNPDATDEVMVLSEWNEPPGPGQQYMLIEVAVGYAGNGIGSVDDLMFDPMLDYTTFFDTYSCDTGMGMMAMAPLLFPGAQTTVTVCALVETGSVESIVLMATTMEDLDAMPPFFSLQP
jgi:hypothetical protein